MHYLNSRQPLQAIFVIQLKWQLSSRGWVSYYSEFPITILNREVKMNIITKEEIENLFETLHPKLDSSNIITVDDEELSKVLNFFCS